ncbi:MAG: hypothetical protein LC768_03045 [Acidobacteria bacterium]|nr:hypothetical protein [Acidobacteriota bacterium]MCA1637308.1 hypothetical protein [Acidobacteriota bacterium]
MKTNKNLLTFATILACIFGLTFTANAQKRKAPRKKIRTATVAATTAATSSEIKAGAGKVSVQIKNVSKFIYNLGGVARVIEDLDREIASGKASRNAPDLNAKNKQAVVSSIKGIRAGLAALEIEFRTKPALRNYLFQIQGISDMSGRAEDQASAGQLTESGKTLLLVVEKLSDTLAALP